MPSSPSEPADSAAQPCLADCIDVGLCSYLSNHLSGQVDYSCLKYSYSIVAAAAVFCANLVYSDDPCLPPVRAAAALHVKLSCYCA